MELNDVILSDEALNAIDNGIWIDDIEGFPGLKLMVVGISSKESQKALTQKQAAMRLKSRGKPLTPDQLAKCMRETLAEVVIKDWNLKQAGNPVEFTRERAIEFIIPRNGDNLARAVLLAAQQVDDDASELIKEVSKNS
jgi:hypothetical protein